MSRTAGKLGMKDVEPDERDLLFEHFRKPEEITVPEQFGGDDGLTEFYMFGNGPEETDEAGVPAEGCGDCFWAGSAEETRMWSAFGLAEADVFTAAGVVSDYSAGTGYVVGDESTDQGTEPRQGLLYRQKTGIIDASSDRHKIGMFCVGKAQDFEQMLEMALIFDGVGLGFEIPNTAQTQFSNHEPWELVEGEEIEGGHWVPFRRRIDAETFTIVTWAAEQEVKQTWFEKRNTAVFGIFSVESLRQGKNPDGLDTEGLLAAAKSLGLELVQPS
jgi:hypothetical protein